jgi:integrase
MEQGLSPSTVNRDLACLRRILTFAVRISRPSDGKPSVKWRLLTTPFVAHGVEFLKENQRERTLTYGEERKYLAASSQPLRDVATIIAEMGCRPGEVCAIRRSDVHLSAASLHVAAGKTKNAVRDVPITERAREVLKRRMTAGQRRICFSVARWHWPRLDASDGRSSPGPRASVAR